VKLVQVQIRKQLYTEANIIHILIRKQVTIAVDVFNAFVVFLSTFHVKIAVSHINAFLNIFFFMKISCKVLSNMIQQKAPNR